MRKGHAGDEISGSLVDGGGALQKDEWLSVGFHSVTRFDCTRAPPPPPLGPCDSRTLGSQLNLRGELTVASQDEPGESNFLYEFLYNPEG